MNLHLDNNVNFISILPGQLLSTFSDNINKFYQSLFDRNYIPFAHYCDWGVVCFNANGQVPNNDYEVVYFDHEDEYANGTFLAQNFLRLFETLNMKLDISINQIHEANKNTT